MTTTHLRGLTWDHPRAILPLRAAEEALRLRFPNVSLTWDVQPLSGFESRPMAETAAIYDLIIYDHPHVGEVAGHHLLRPMESVLATAGLSNRHFAGPSLASYEYAGHVWALPLDAACQVSCARSELLGALDTAFPADWTGVLELGERARRKGYKLAIAYSGVHSLMVLLSLCANQRTPLAASPGDGFVDRKAVETALAAMAQLLHFCPREVLDWNSIDVQDQMCARDDLVFCPAVYGFSPYSWHGRQRRLTYGNLAGLRSGSGGSTLGGAGLGVSAFSDHAEAAFSVAAFLVEAQTQESIIGLHNGQPAHVAAWESRQVNDQSGDFYTGTRTTIEGAWVRPRFNGYLNFQRAGGTIVERCLRGMLTSEAAFDLLEESWSTSVSQETPSA